MTTGSASEAVPAEADERPPAAPAVPPTEAAADPEATPEVAPVAAGAKGKANAGGAKAPVEAATRNGTARKAEPAA
jgi:hypothetical protein